MNDQIIYYSNSYEEYRTTTEKLSIKNLLLVCGASLQSMELGKRFLKDDNIKYVFQEFEPNPKHESVLVGVDKYLQNDCDGIIAIGGGSAIDVAKAIKWEIYNEKGSDIQIPLLVAPTTAGTGSEGTTFAVIYYDGEKRSIDSNDLLPNIVFLEEEFLRTLPLYQRKVTMLDALCHSIESMWSVNATDLSRNYAEDAIKLIIANYKGYLNNDIKSNSKMQEGAFLAGKAINISKTTGAHAMCYKITTLFNVAHGEAAAICLSNVWEATYNKACELNNTKLINIMQSISELLGASNPKEGNQKFKEILVELDIKQHYEITDENLKELVNSVNVQRLSNHPVEFTKIDIQEIYSKMK